MATRVWGAGSGAGTDGDWNNAANWTGDTAPVDGDDVVFDGAVCAIQLLVGNSTYLYLNSITSNEYLSAGGTFWADARPYNLYIDESISDFSSYSASPFINARMADSGGSTIFGDWTIAPYQMISINLIDYDQSPVDLDLEWNSISVEYSTTLTSFYGTAIHFDFNNNLTAITYNLIYPEPVLFDFGGIQSLANIGGIASPSISVDKTGQNISYNCDNFIGSSVFGNLSPYGNTFLWFGVPYYHSGNLFAAPYIAINCATLNVYGNSPTQINRAYDGTNTGAYVFAEYDVTATNAAYFNGGSGLLYIGPDGGGLSYRTTTRITTQLVEFKDQSYMGWYNLSGYVRIPFGNSPWQNTSAFAGYQTPLYFTHPSSPTSEVTINFKNNSKLVDMVGKMFAISGFGNGYMGFIGCSVGTAAAGQPSAVNLNMFDDSEVIGLLTPYLGVVDSGSPSPIPSSFTLYGRSKAAACYVGFDNAAYGDFQFKELTPGTDKTIIPSGF